ncbi:hypothetical protein [Conyzicola sp.]|uniref:hypothetical protein n=1 Tax=Conyzicola sp. TaxID=1969404 RepID=UPI003988B5F1
MRTIVFDPGLALSTFSSPVEQSRFWVRFVEWERDERVAMGSETHGAVSHFYATRVCSSGSSVPAGMSKGVHRAMKALLSRPPLKNADSFRERTLDVKYLGKDANATILAIDIGAMQHASELHLAIAAECWPAGVTVGRVLPAPPERVFFQTVPNSPTESERWEARADALQDFKLLVVGGQPDRSVAESLLAKLNVDRSRLVWVPCEKSKPPRNLDAQIKGTRDSQTIVICITGKMGHSTSNKVRENCTKVGIPLVNVESAGEILPKLGKYADALVAAARLALSTGADVGA